MIKVSHTISVTNNFTDAELEKAKNTLIILIAKLVPILEKALVDEGLSGRHIGTSGEIKRDVPNIPDNY